MFVVVVVVGLLLVCSIVRVSELGGKPEEARSESASACGGERASIAAAAQPPRSPTHTQI